MPRLPTYPCPFCDEPMTMYAMKKHLLDGTCRVFEVIDKIEGERMRAKNSLTFNALQDQTIALPPTIVKNARLRLKNFG